PILPPCWRGEARTPDSTQRIGWFVVRPAHHRGHQPWAGAVAVSPSEKERLHTAVLVAPAAERRRLRKQRRQAATRLQAEQRRQEIAAAKTKAEAEKAERRATRYLPAAGEPGPV